LFGPTDELANYAPPAHNPIMPISLQRVLWAFALIACAVANGATQRTDPFSEYLVDSWTTEEGLPSDTISGVLQTSDGYLWCSTYDGLVRFDGARFVRVGPNEPADRQASRILCLYQDRKGHLLLGTDGAGLLRYDGQTFTTVVEVEEGSSFNVVRSVAEDAAGNIWLGTRGGLGRWSDGVVTWMVGATGYTNVAFSIWNLAFDRQERLWITDWISLKAFSNGAFETGLMRPEAKPLRAVYPAPSGDLWVGMLGQSMRRNASGEWSEVGEASQFGRSEVVAFCETEAGGLWLGARKGLYQWRDGRWTLFERRGLDAAEVRVLFEDRRGNLWVGTGTGGLIRLKRRLLETFARSEGLTDDAVLAIRQDAQGRMWAGAADGRVFLRETGPFQPWSVVDGKSLGAPVKTIMHARDGATWVGTFGNGLMRFKEGRSDRFLPVVGTFARVDKINSVLEDRAGTLWVGAFYSLYRLGESNLLVQVPVGGREVLAQVMAIVEGQNGLWVAFDGLGVVRISGNEALWITRREGLPTHFVRTLYEDAAGDLWIGTTAGLCCWRAGKINKWSAAEGLPNDTILQILEDDAGNLWLGSKAGIVRVAKADLRAVAESRKALLDVFAYGRGEGMLDVECSGPLAVKTHDQKFWFPTSKGVVVADPAELRRRSSPAPPVHIEEVRADGKIVARPHTSPRHVSNRQLRPEVTELPHHTRRIEFIYTAAALTSPERVRFRHRLEGFDADWTDAGNVRSAVYTKLAPGDYRFQVIASNNDGVWNEAGHAHTFRILAPFWKRAWFIAPVGLISIGSLAALVRFVSVRHLRRKLRRLEEAHAVEKERMRIAQDMHDEIGGKLSRISFLSDMACQNVPASSEASQQIDQVSETARDVIRTVDEIVWAVSPRNDTLDSALHYVCRHAEEFFEFTPIELVIELPGEVPALRLSAEVRHNLFCAVKEALNNVLKHSQANTVRVRFDLHPANLEITITDNGKGFDPVDALHPVGHQSSPSAGDGLLNMRERMESVGGQCTIQSRVGGGTCVLLSVPLKHVEGRRIKHA
jgi:ligand-binding sensor domain-containing protein/signal transduction histidine kinase